MSKPRRPQLPAAKPRLSPYRGKQKNWRVKIWIIDLVCKFGGKTGHLQTAETGVTAMRPLVLESGRPLPCLL
ncbi:MAG TPA: hypothetical protein DET40_04650 [Lentisphaeria bacterium]|nr:hypothetical protein [Lentisphaeria bacterium]